MARYTSVSVTGYNSSPPADDGSTTEANKVKWATVKTKLSDPIKTAIDDIQTALEASFNTPITFSANKNGTDQTSVTTGTKITFGTEDWDTGSYFASSTWTPPAGKYRISAAMGLSSGLTDTTAYGLNLYKNGSLHRQLQIDTASGTGTLVLSGSCIVDANGTDTFEIYYTGATTVTVSGNTASTWFQGEQL